MNTRLRFIPTVMLALAALAGATLGPGCSAVTAAAPGVGSAVYLDGTLEAAVAAPYDKSVRAAQRTIEALKFAKVSEKPEPLRTTLVVRSAEEKRIEIHLESRTDHTKVTIRVGVLGEEALSRAILAQIKAGL